MNTVEIGTDKTQATSLSAVHSMYMYINNDREHKGLILMHININYSYNFTIYDTILAKFRLI